MDLTFRRAEGTFNVRAAAVILHEERLLTVVHGNAGHYALPGGRVHLHETMEQAIHRELQEELGFTPASVRPLWLNQAFFTVADGTPFHELAIYYLVDFTGSNLLKRGETFEGRDGPLPLHFRWLPLSSLKDVKIVPTFIKEHIFHLPEHLELISNYQSISGKD